MTGPVSVVIPTYNSERFIREALQSVFDQTLRPHEVIVVDDASTDETAAIVQDVARHAPVPVHLRRRRVNSGGPSLPVNEGIEQAVGSLIATHDHDDVMLPERLESQVSCLIKCPDVGIIIGRCEGFSELQQPLSDMPRIALGERHYRVVAHEAYRALILARNYALTCSSYLFPRSIWVRCGGFDEGIRTACDYAFLQRVLRDHDLGFVDHTIVRWRIRDDSLYRVSSRLRRREELLAIYHRFEPQFLDARLRQALDQLLQNDHLVLAYLHRQEGNYRCALLHYLAVLGQSGWNRQAALGLLKLFPHRLLRGARCMIRL